MIRSKTSLKVLNYMFKTGKNIHYSMFTNRFICFIFRRPYIPNIHSTLQILEKQKAIKRVGKIDFGNKNGSLQTLFNLTPYGVKTITSKLKKYE